jgi:6-phosphogluconolactonase
MKQHMKVFTFLLLLSVYQVSYSQSSYLISGTYTNAEKSKGIYIYEFNSAAGTAKFISSIYTDNPSYLALDKNNSHVYAVNEVGDGKGAVSSFSFDKKNGSLHLINRQLTNEDDPCYISIDSSNKWAAVANYSGGSFSLFPVMADGSLGASVQTIRHSGSGPGKAACAFDGIFSGQSFPRGNRPGDGQNKPLPIRCLKGKTGYGASRGNQYFSR